MGGRDSKEIQKATIDPAMIPSTQFRVNAAMRRSIIPTVEELAKVAISPQMLNESAIQMRVTAPLDYCQKEEWVLPTQSLEECTAVSQYVSKIFPDGSAFKASFLGKTTGFDLSLLARKPVGMGNAGGKVRSRGPQIFRKNFPELNSKLLGRKVFSIDALFAGFNMGGRKRSQDSTLIDYIITPGGATYIFLADFDGHGEYGTEMSAFAASVIAGQLARNLPSGAGPIKSAEKVFKALKETFRIVQSYYEKEEPEKSLLSGTTATCLLVTNSRAYCAYVGDSKAIILKESSLQVMTRPHHFDEPIEKSRALAEGRECSIRKIQLRPGVEAGPLRIFVKGTESPGLAMSRSLGDCEAHRVGCSAFPEFMEVDISSCNSFQLITASDGLWDEIEPEEVLRLIYSNQSEFGFQEGIGKLLQESCRRWTHKQVGIVDDISLVGLFFNVGDFEQAAAESKEEEKRDK